jgi:AcrR family transcriptional regulator
MGLRAKKVARTRENIIAVAIELFEADGYDQTTMEAIAEAAEVGTSTLYRYFQAKDSILLGPFAPTGTFAEIVRTRPQDEELFDALTQSIRLVVAETASDPQVLRVRALLDQNPLPRARLWDFLAQQRALLEEAISERVGLPVDDLGIAVTARIALLVLELASDTWRGEVNGRSMSDITETIMEQLTSMSIFFTPASTQAVNRA